MKPDTPIAWDKLRELQTERRLPVARQIIALVCFGLTAACLLLGLSLILDRNELVEPAAQPFLGFLVLGLMALGLGVIVLLPNPDA